MIKDSEIVSYVDNENATAIRNTFENKKAIEPDGRCINLLIPNQVLGEWASCVVLGRLLECNGIL